MFLYFLFKKKKKKISESIFFCYPNLTNLVNKKYIFEKYLKITHILFRKNYKKKNIQNKKIYFFTLV